LTTKYVLIIFNRHNYAIKTHYRLPLLFTLTLHDGAAIFFVRFCKWEGVGHFALKVGKDAEKIRGDMPDLNNSKIF